MQRFGRAVRDLLLEGRAILIAEKSCFWKEEDDDSDGESDGDGDGAVTNMRRAQTGQTVAGSRTAARPPASQLPNPRPVIPAKRKRKGSQLGPSMDLFVNANKIPSNCRRKVVNVHYNNDKAGEYHIITNSRTS